MFNIAIIGGGVIGGACFRELTKYKGKFCLLEKEDDVCMGQSKANSGIVHAGFDAVPNSNKAKFNVLGNKMMPSYAKELGVKYHNNGSLVLGFNEQDLEVLTELKQRGEKNGVPGLEIIQGEKLFELEPNLNKNVTCALVAPTGGIVCPYELTIAEIGNAMDNGGQLFCNFEVEEVIKEADGFTIKSANGQVVQAQMIINCAGFFGGKIASLCGDDSIKIGGRKGEYILLDRESGGFVSHTLFTAPTKAGKGILVTQTVDNNILLGPTAVEVDNDQRLTSKEGLSLIIQKVGEMCANVPLFNSITSFCGVRAYSDKHDFIIEHSQKVNGLINCVGIESPGLTSAPAIGEYVVNELVLPQLKLEKNHDFNGVRKPENFFKNLSTQEKNELIKKDNRYGKIVCRCERITEGEIVNAIHANPRATSVDAVKRRTRAGMGRCQGGFCQSIVAEILARELNISMEEVTKNGKGSELLVGKCKWKQITI